MAFLQYKAGAIPGKPLKRKVTPEEMRERKKQYEKDRERKCIDSWKQNRLCQPQCSGSQFDGEELESANSNTI